MAKNKTVECTLILRRVYDVPVERLWRAWTDPKELGQWYVAGDDHIIHFCEADVRVGGTYRVGFGKPGTPPYVETGRYTEIVPMKSLAAEEMVSLDGKEFGNSRYKVEFRDLGDGRSELVLTTTGDEVWRSGEGWTPCLESLARYVAT